MGGTGCKLRYSGRRHIITEDGSEEFLAGKAPSMAQVISLKECE